MVGTLVVGLLTLEKRDLALALLLRQSDGKVSLLFISRARVLSRVIVKREILYHVS